MATASFNKESQDTSSAGHGDSLAFGIVFLLSLTVIQRLVGFCRSILFCRLLTDEQLGRWSLAFSFLLMAAPLAVLGIPGSFGRYFEYYQQRGQGRAFIRKTTIVSGFLAALVIASILAFPRFYAWLVFSSTDATGYILSLAVVLIAVIAFNYLIEIFTAMRCVRVVSWMQLVNGLTFATVGVGLLALTDWGVSAVIAAAGSSMTLAATLGLWLMWRTPELVPRDTAPLNGRDLWSRLIPFAAWIWVSDSLFNLFDAADRFMIVHFAEVNADAMVGQYHSSRVIPMLLVAIAAMFSGVLLPYLSHEWEAGRRAKAGEMVTLATKVCGLLLGVGGLAILTLSPFIFDWLLQGQYSDGLRVLPLTIAYCIWFAMITISQSFLLCAERAHLGCVALLVGLVVNVVLNALLLPQIGLPGAVIATMSGNLVALVMTQYFNQRLGVPAENGVLLIVALPALLLIDPQMAAACGVLLTFWIYKGTTILSRSEKQLIATTIQTLLRKLPFGRT